MSENAERDLRNVIVFALADGKLADEEKEFIDSLRVKLRIDDAEFRELCAQVRADRTRVSLPRGAAEAEDAVRLLVRTAAADREVSEKERRMLRRLAEYADMAPARLEELIDQEFRGQQVDEGQLQASVDDIYASFAQWDEATRRGKIGELGALGYAGVFPLLRILESYRAPDGAENALELKMLIVEQLGEIGDKRAAYYLAQQVSIGDRDDEMTNPALRRAAAEALGKVVGEGFSNDDEGLAAAKEWWVSTGIRQFNQLAF